MAAAALTVALLALLASVWAAKAAHSQALSAATAAGEAREATRIAEKALAVAQEATALERDRRYSEQAPRLVATVDDDEAVEWQTVTLRNDSSVPYDSLAMTIRPSNDPIVDGFRSGLDPTEVVDEIGPVGGLGLGQEFAFDLVRTDLERHGRVYLLATLTRGPQSWSVEVPVDLQREFRVHVY